jgi:hypothetical protein
MTRYSTSALCCFVLASTAAVPAALAKPGCIFQDAHVFTTPAYGAGLIGTIPAPAPVQVVRRGEKWSLVSYDGESGYVATAHLSPRSALRADPPPSVGYVSPSNVLRREIDPLTIAFWPYGGRGPFVGSRFGGASYFSGFRRSGWTDRTNWRRDQRLSADDSAWAACAEAEGPARREGRAAR